MDLRCCQKRVALSLTHILFYSCSDVHGFLRIASDSQLSELVTGDETVFGIVHSEVVGDNLEISINITDANCSLTEAHVCNMPIIRAENIDDPKHHGWSLDIADVYNFACYESGDTFLVDGHATVVCDASDTLQGAMFQIPLICEEEKPQSIAPGKPEETRSYCANKCQNRRTPWVAQEGTEQKCNWTEDCGGCPEFSTNCDNCKSWCFDYNLRQPWEERCNWEECKCPAECGSGENRFSLTRGKTRSSFSLVHPENLHEQNRPKVRSKLSDWISDWRVWASAASAAGFAATLAAASGHFHSLLSAYFR